MLKVDIVCPIYKDVDEIKSFIKSLKTQKNIEIGNIVLPHTLSSNKEDEEIRKVINYKKVIYFKVDQKDFSHSLTRQKTVEEYCMSPIVVFCSQDITFNDSNSIYNLASNINDEIVYAYGRQICTKNTIEKYIRQKNYGNSNIIVSKEDIDKLQIMAFFASDAFSAINREVFIKLNGYQGYNVNMNEDQLYSKIVLDNGYKKMYVANAIVNHSHKYTLKQLYTRYYNAGKFYKDVKIFDEYKTNESGIKLGFYVLKQALKHFNIKVILRWPFDMGARYFGMKKGRK